jgi:hypothetical protein
MKRGLVVAMSVLGAIACSPANVAGTPADAGAGVRVDGGVSAERACADSAYARCTQVQSCSTSAVQFRFGDLHTCETVYQAVCLATLIAPSTGATTATVEACVPDIAKWPCVDFLFNQNPPPACQRQIGLLADGSPCGLGQQCQSAFCSIDSGHMCGACGPAPKPGDSCANLATCGSALNCMSATFECQSYVEMGGGCSLGLPCAAGLACVGYNMQTSAPGICQPATATPGAACSFVGAGCDVFAGLSCNAHTQTCGTAQIGAPGQACGLVANQEAYCASSGVCVAGSCQGSAGLGAPCDFVKGPFCIDLERCIADVDGGTSGTCQTPSGSTCL